MKKILLYSAFITFGFICKAQTVSDVDGNTYDTVKIGTQIWMKENLKTTKYNDGNAIPEVSSRNWDTLKTPAYCWYSSTDKVIYGALYNWLTVNTNKLCPTGWHVPSKNEWSTLTTYLGGESVAGVKLKEMGTTHWHSPNSGADNSSGFTALPGGERDYDGNCGYIGYWGSWWTATRYDTGLYWSKAWAINMHYSTDDAPIYFCDWRKGYSVRCLSDNLVNNLNNVHTSELHIFPNPVEDKLNIINENNSNVIIAIYDLQGKQVLSKSINSNSIDISEIQSGIYLVKLIDSGSIKTIKMIKK